MAAEGTRLYLVRERLTGEAHYEVYARNKSEALVKVRRCEGGNMTHSIIDHLGVGEVERIADDH